MELQIQEDGSCVFHLKCILSVTTGRLLSEKGIGGVYDILNFMTGDNLFTHQLPRAATECKPHLIHQIPWLRGLASDAEGPAFLDWAKGLVEASKDRGGPFYSIHRLHPEHHERKDPVEELHEMTSAPIICVDPHGQGGTDQ